jgi:hypothetical protein
LEFKNIILEVILANKFKNGQEKLLPEKASCKSLNFRVQDIQARGPNTMETFTPEKFSRPFPK